MIFRKSDEINDWDDGKILTDFLARDTNNG